MAADISNLVRMATPVNVNHTANASVTRTDEVAAPVATSEAATERQKEAASVVSETAVASNQQAEVVEQVELNDAVTYINDHFQNIQRNLEFSVEEDTGKVLVRVYDTETEELVRQIPGEQAIKMAQIMHEKNQEADELKVDGFLLQEKA
ncbi:MAG: flagellar protein FlaG [Thiotrichaceae bacterium]|nr:flagellar protein FlaG [Thiotrichaceae bacterium]